MTGFDIIVLIVIGIAAIGGFLRGFVQEVLSLAAWILAIFAIHYMHTPLTTWLYNHVIATPSGSAVLAFALLLLIPYAGMKLIAGRLGEASRNSLLGPIDRVLGFGFGAIKGGIIIVMAFAVLMLGYDTIMGVAGRERPVWIVNARTYPIVNAGSDAMVQLLDERRREIESADNHIPGGKE